MDASNSDLSKYGISFVVAVTQLRLNSAMEEYLCESTQPDNFFCFLSDPATGNPASQIDLQDLKNKTGGIDPFEIPHDTPSTDPRVQALTKVSFAFGVKLRLGIPLSASGDPDANLPPVLELRDSSQAVVFRMYCSEFKIVQNVIGPSPNWTVWNQQPGSPCYAETLVDLVNDDLDKELNTPYFSQRPGLQANMKGHIENISDTAFSLQQLLFDLDNAALQTAPSFVGVPTAIQSILEEYFVGLYVNSAKNYGQPLIAMTAVPDDTLDGSALQITHFDRVVSPYKDVNGAVIRNPTRKQSDMATLDHLCMVGGKPLPDYKPFQWNWVETQNADSQGGTVSISREVFWEYLNNSIFAPAAAEYCRRLAPSMQPDPDEYTCDFNIELTSLGIAEFPYSETPSGSNQVLDFSYSYRENASAFTGYGTNWELEVSTSYSSSVTVQDSTTIICKQSMLAKFTFSGTHHGGGGWSVTKDFTVYDASMTDTYTLSVGQDGSLQIVANPSLHQSNVVAPKLTTGYDDVRFKVAPDVDTQLDGTVSWNANVAKLNPLAETLRGQINLEPFQITSMDVPGLRTFVFPGAKVAAYSSAMLSKNYDLICNINYVDPVGAIPVQGTPSMDIIADICPVSVPTFASVSPAMTLTSSTHMIQNYVHGKVIDLTGKFEAVQTDDGHSLLFSMDKANVLNAVVENSGTSKTGWMRLDLSSAAITQKFTDSPGSSVRTFDVCQDTISGTIGMTMVVTSQGKDNLFVSLNNPNTGSSWSSDTPPPWTSIAFDVQDDSVDSSALSIVGTMFQGTANDQFIIVDIDRSSDSAVKDIVRYFVYPHNQDGNRWTHHQALPDLQDNTYQSCVGKPKPGMSTGIYNSGTTGNAAQLEFVPFSNPFGGPPTPSRFTLPGNAIPSAIAVTKNPDQSTDLFIIGGSALHRLPADGQQEGAIAKVMITNILFSGTTKMSAMVHDGATTIWGLNGGGLVFYTTCPNEKLNVPTAWSIPLPLDCDVDIMSSYMNQSTGCNTIFTSGGTNLQRMVQATNTVAKVWKSDGIKVDAALTEKSISFNSYTTTIQVVVDEQELPAIDTPVAIKAASHMTAYINGMYYALSQNATTIQTDKSGILTIVEPINDSINGTILTISCDDWATSTEVNPMHDPFQKMATLNTNTAVLGAQYPATTVAGGIVGTPKMNPLVSPTTDSVALGTTALTMKNLGSAYASINGTASTATSKATIPANVSMCIFGGMLDGMKSAFGDLDRFGKTAMKAVRNEADKVGAAIVHEGDQVGKVIEKGVDSVAEHVSDAVHHAVSIVEDTVTNTWHLVVKIADQEYHAALTTVDAIVGAVEWVFHAVETAIEDIIHFLEFLFEWDDIKRTKNVICNLTKLWVSGQVESFSTAQVAFDTGISSLESSINQWAGITDWSSGLGDMANEPVSAKASNPASGQTSSSQMLANHFKTHATQITVAGMQQPTVEQAQGLFSDLLAALQKEGDVLNAAYQSLSSLASDFHSLSLTEILEKLVAIIGNTLLSSVQTVVDALFTALTSVSGSALSVLETTIHIPVISDILDALDVPEISFLDVICWVGAVAYTIVYKAVHDEPPFPDISEITSIVNANTWDTIKSLLPTLTASTANTLYVSLHGVDSFMTFLSAFISAVEAEQPQGNSWGKWSSVTSKVSAASCYVANTVLTEDPLQGSTLNDISSAITAANVITSLVLSHSGKQDKLKTNTPPCGGLAMNGRATGAIIDAVMVIPPLVITGIHLSQLSHDQAGIQRSAAIVAEVTNITDYISKVAYAVAVNDNEPETKEVAIGVMVLDILAEAGLKATQSMIVSGALSF